MSPTVRAQWLTFNAPLEGRVTWMYLDVRGLVTTGIGFLIDPLPAALDLPWVKPDGTLAARGEIMVEWQQVKANLALAHTGAGAAERVTQLRLTDATVDASALAKFDANAATLSHFPAFSALDTWPDGAQLALASMAWAMGPGFGPHWPHFAAACEAQDWAAAAANCWMDDSHNAGLTARNEANRAALLGCVATA